MIFSSNEILSDSQMGHLMSIVQLGNVVYNELLLGNPETYSHCYMNSMRTRLRTRLMQMQAEIESHEPGFPFAFSSRHVGFGQLVPELYTDNVILHIAHSNSPDSLPSPSKYKTELSWNNHPIQRQVAFGSSESATAEKKFAPLYGLLVFGDDRNPFTVIQIPEPGYTHIAHTISIPEIKAVPQQETSQEFKRKKAALKARYNAENLEAQSS